MRTEQAPIEWFFANLFEPLYSHADAMELTGVTHDTLQNWANRKIVRPKLINRKRRYNGLEVAQLAVAHSLVQHLGLEPSRATLGVVMGLLIFQRKLKAGEFSLRNIEHQVLVFTASYEEPELFDVRKDAAKVFEKEDSILLLPAGRLLNALASRQRKLVESRMTAKDAPPEKKGG
jgi:hypothetical protein